MEAELAALAASGATTLIALMVSDTWTQVKERFARAFSRTGDSEDLLRDLEVSRATLMAALAHGDDEKAAEIEIEWRSRLLYLMRSDPGLIEELRSLPTSPVGTVYNSISGKVQSGLVIQAGRISGSTFHPVRPDDHAGESEDEAQSGLGME
ncbi:hypothetical protein ACFQVD_07505 [Streptosporangium amethystogenes subsp. fukuiense]|uniref:Uncharacterized protein n=1 Tax=Streptosporangium amethystogenes subsp. fukuiense TaxID=698418 RepID=A0ABW2SUJ1_9ACTN